MKTEGVVVIKALLQQNNIVPQFWQSALVRYLAQTLKISIEKNYLVQASVLHGKILWRIIDDQGNVFYDRSYVKKNQPYQISAEKSWLMPWAMFQSFKATGKRYSNNLITREIFMFNFIPNFQFNAGRVWDELRRQNIISAKCKLTDNWRIFSREHLVISPDICGSISYEEIVIVLNRFGQVNLIEMLPVESHFKVIRTDRSPKQTFSTGLIENQTPTDPGLCTKLWDVTLKCDATAHRNTSEEEKLYGDKLNYDHIMASQNLKPKAYEEIERRLATLNVLHSELQQLQAQLQIAQNQQQAKTPVSANTRGALTQLQFNNPEIANLTLQIQNKTESILLTNSLIKGLKAEVDNKEGGFWWTVAIPIELHKQGKTYLKIAPVVQGEPLLIRDFKCYLEILEKRPEEFKLTHTDILFALGAFRLLYRKQSVVHEPIPNSKKHVGYAPVLFFNGDNNVTFNLVDTFFNQRIKRYLDQREGFEARTMLVPKQLSFNLLQNQ